MKSNLRKSDFRTDLKPISKTSKDFQKSSHGTTAHGIKEDSKKIQRRIREESKKISKVSGATYISDVVFSCPQTAQ